MGGPLSGPPPMAMATLGYSQAAIADARGHAGATASRPAGRATYASPAASTPQAQPQAIVAPAPQAVAPAARSPARTVRGNSSRARARQDLQALPLPLDYPTALSRLLDGSKP
jgi:hypothetical protein